MAEAAKDSAETTTVDRWVIYTRDEEYNGIHPGIGVKFMNGEAVTEDEEIAKEAKRHATLTVRKAKPRVVADEAGEKK